ncbi:Bacterial extracellular solute-binding, family 1 [Moorella glycerini]|uniref:Bacterial extracellular solute-binding protein n=1 Tax=Neomoorella stamsii TaxID=1266720 RepID=A0A9X7P7E3_9FIRM|nr:MULTISPECIES: extracellular solute-binding protein [Moorella]PRR76450.1 Bacterial extracellular solute-binding protein [Moorella stamsii]CEP66981.1 Bacterial extracellular solute-binding, family 1 [Moorella glycerini]
MKRSMLLAACGVLIMVLVATAGCGGKGKPEAEKKEGTAPQTVQTQGGRFGLDQIPEIRNKQPITMVLETGEGYSKMLPAIEKFTAKTGVKVNVERVASSGVYAKENVELKAGTGYYDLVYVETSWTTEWSDYLYKLNELADKYDPGGRQALQKELENMAPSILACGQAYGEQMVLPFYTFDMCMWVRQDVYDDPTEQANFKQKYGYDLKPPTNEKELRDQAEFFTRKKGELLKGKPLDHDVFGVSMQAGAYQCNDETTARLWAMGQDWVTVVRDEAGKVKEFVITKQNKEALKKALSDYKELLKYDAPSATTANFDFVVAQLGNGNAIIVPTIWANCTVWADSVLKTKVPEGRIGVYPSPGGRPYTGAWSYGVAKASKNPEAAYWLLRYLTSYECGRVIFKEGGMIPARIDVLSDVLKEEPRYPYGMLAEYHINIWKQMAPYIRNYFYFNTKAGGKVYDMQIYAVAKALTGEKSIDETVDYITQQTLDLVSKFDTVPIREEK